MIERVRGLDTAFLSFETADTPLQVTQTCLFDPSTAGSGYSFERVRDLVQSRLSLCPPFRRRLVDVPLSLHHPVWIEDPDFDLDRHLHPVTLHQPGNLAQLAQLTADLAARPLNRDRPLWDMYIVDGLEGGLIAGVTTVHHCAIDGVSGAELTANLLDLEPEPDRDLPDTTRWVPDKRPSPADLVLTAAGDIARQPFAAVGTARRLVEAALGLRRRNRRPGAVAPPAPFSAPATPLDCTPGSRRRLAFTELALDDFLSVKEAFGVTFNDVILAVCSGALRGLLAGWGCQPSRPLVAAVPVSVRTEDQKGSMGNRLSAMLVDLATDLDGPVGRLRAIASGSKEAKDQDRLLGPTLLSDIIGLVPPSFGSPAAQVVSWLGLLHRPRPLCNVVVSTFPGPAQPLYCAGARLVAPYPIGPVADGASLNITAQTYLDTVYLGVVVGERSPADPWDISSRLGDALSELVKAAA